MAKREPRPLRVVTLPLDQAKQPHELDVQSKVVRIPLDLIDDNPIPARRAYPSALIETRAEEIIRDGLLDPIKVRPNPDSPGRFFLIDGKTRVEAFRRFELDSAIDAIVRNVDSITAAIQGFAANHDRDNGCDLDEAYLVHDLLIESGKTQTQLAQDLGVSQSRMSQLQAFFKLQQASLDIILQSENPDAVTYKHVQLITASLGAQRLDDELKIITALVTQKWTLPELKQALSAINTQPKKRSATPQTIQLAGGIKLTDSGRKLEVSGLKSELKARLLEKIKAWMEDELRSE